MAANKKIKSSSSQLADSLIFHFCNPDPQAIRYSAIFPVSFAASCL
jgi:hypothetical protein